MRVMKPMNYFAALQLPPDNYPGRITLQTACVSILCQRSLRSSLRHHRQVCKDATKGTNHCIKLHNTYGYEYLCPAPGDGLSKPCGSCEQRVHRALHNATREDLGTPPETTTRNLHDDDTASVAAAKSRHHYNPRTNVGGSKPSHSRAMSVSDASDTVQYQSLKYEQTSSLSYFVDRTLQVVPGT